jgi:hypothetical protein
MREKDSFRKKTLLTKIENLIAKREAEKNNLPYEEYKLDAQYIQGYIAGLEEARRIMKGLPSDGWRPSAVHQRLVETRKKEKTRTEGEGSGIAHCESESSSIRKPLKNRGPGAYPPRLLEIYAVRLGWYANSVSLLHMPSIGVICSTVVLMRSS